MELLNIKRDFYTNIFKGFFKKVFQGPSGQHTFYMGSSEKQTWIFRNIFFKDYLLIVFKYIFF